MSDARSRGDRKAPLLGSYRHSLAGQKAIAPEEINFDNELIKYWKSQTVSDESRRAWFSRMISIYDKPEQQQPKFGQYFAQSQYPSMYNFLSSTYETDFAIISEWSRIVYPQSEKREQVIRSLIWRVGGYSGHLRTDWFDLEKFSRKYENKDNGDLDMSIEAARRLSLLPSGGNTLIENDPMITYSLSAAIDRTYAYGILSPTKVYRNEELENQYDQEHWIHVLHIWGVNFESPSTQDWLKFVAKSIKSSDSIKISDLAKAYRHRMIELFSIIRKSIVETAEYVVRNKPDTQTLNVWIPGIGLNNFLKGLMPHGGGQEAIEACTYEFLKVMNDLLFAKSDLEILKTATPNVTNRVSNNTLSLKLRFVEYSGLPPVASERKRNLKHIVTQQPDSGPRSYRQGPIFDYDHTLANEYFFLVNAWDPMTFIGNGGSRDGSMDGWFGGGYTRGGFACTAWLSNLHMIPSLIDHMVDVEGI